MSSHKKMYKTNASASIKTMADNDIVGLVSVFDRLPYQVLQTILLNAGDPLDLSQLRKFKFVFPTLKWKTIEQALERAYENDIFWQTWLKQCFPRVTEKPDYIDSWRLFAAIIYSVVRNVTVTTRGESMLFVDNPQVPASEVVPILSEWPSFKDRLNQSLTCSHIFNHLYKYDFTIDKGEHDFSDNKDRWSPTSSVNIYVKGPFDRILTDTEIYHGEIPHSILHYDGVYFSRELGREDIIHEDLAADGEEWDYSFASENNSNAGWGLTRTIEERVEFSSITCRISIDPRRFIRDELFSSDGELRDAIIEKHENLRALLSADYN